MSGKPLRPRVLRTPTSGDLDEAMAQAVARGEAEDAPASVAECVREAWGVPLTGEDLADLRGEDRALGHRRPTTRSES